MSEVIPEGWTRNALTKYCDVVGGGTPDRSVKEYWDGDIPWISPTEVTSNTTRFVSRTKEKITQLGLERSSAKLHPAGSLLMTSRASIGYVAINTVPMATNQGFQTLRCKQGTLAEYLYYYIDSIRPELERISAGSTFSEIPSSSVKKLEITLPPLPEQQKIATILSSVDDVIEKTRAQIDKLKDLKTGMMQELLTQGIGHTEFKDSPVGRIPASWSILTLGDITESSAFGPRFSSELYSEKGNVGCIRTTDIDADWKINYRSVPLALLPSSEIKNHVLQNGDLLVTRSGTCGVVDVFREQPLPMIAAAFLIRFRLSSKVNPWFIKYLTMSPSVQDLIQQLASGGVQQNLSGTSLKTLQIALPPLSEQNQIVKIISSLEESITLMREKFSHFTQLKKALMQDLLTGKVRVKLDSPEVAAA